MENSFRQEFIDLLQFDPWGLQEDKLKSVSVGQILSIIGIASAQGYLRGTGDAMEHGCGKVLDCWKVRRELTRVN